MRHLVIPIIVLATIGCKRTSEPPPTPGEDSVVAPEPAGKATPEGCNDPADCAERGTLGLLAGEPNSVQMLAYACENDMPMACQNLSTALRSGAIPEDPPMAHAAAERGCKLGNAAACVDLGVDESMGYGGATQNFNTAYERFMIGCEAGEGAGCRYAGVLQHEGSIGEPDPLAALKLFEIGCQINDSDSCFNAGVLIVDGVAGEVPLDVAAEYMARACELGDADGCAAVEKITQAMEEQASKLPGSNLRVGSATVNGLTVESLECRVNEGGAGVLGNMALIAALAERKDKIAKCGAKGTLVEVSWTAAGGKITKADGVGTEGKCVAKVLQKLATPLDGECIGTILLGP